MWLNKLPNCRMQRPVSGNGSPAVASEWRLTGARRRVKLRFRVLTDSLCPLVTSVTFERCIRGDVFKRVWMDDSKDVNMSI